MAMLAAMRYKDYVWPHNPRVYTIDYKREIAVQKFPMGYYRLRDLGLGHRVMRGEGEFVGEGAYEEFKKLASLFYDGGPGTLVHPIWQAANVYFTELSLAQAPRPDYVRYTFTFWEGAVEVVALKEVSAPRTEDTQGAAAGGQPGEQTAGGDGSGGAESGAQTAEGTASAGQSQTGTQTVTGAAAAVWHTVSRGETLWGIARRYKAALADVIALNPQIKNPNLIHPGERVRIK